ncbi:autotransporter domain-containing protein [Bosea sp. 685]|uniref:autotransporter domain-containing protein n=1 Tax=Bosea sp. 685 TaxID=3080057 RepID=UPI0028931CE7|nr:autotransporter domain-containing protein [Bosea sp. 685]WNJ90130.1 autotransporter domain-containing protein [Bosea sp. 685]
MFLSFMSRPVAGRIDFLNRRIRGRGMFFRALWTTSAASIRYQKLLGSTALLASLVALAAPSEALAACSGVNTGAVLCDAANPSGGSLLTSFAGTSTVNVGAGAGINTGIVFWAAAAASVSAGDLTFNHTDPAGITSLVNGHAIALNNTGPGAITYNGSANVTSAATGISAVGNGPITITQSAGVVTAVNNAINVDGAGVGDITINTVGSQINGNIQAINLGVGGVAVTTQAINGSLRVLSNGDLNATVGGDINVAGGNPLAALVTTIQGAGSMNVAINGSVSINSASASGVIVASNGVSANARVFTMSGNTTALATSTAANDSVTATGVGVAAAGSLRASFSGAVSATATATGAGSTATATAARAEATAGSGDLSLVLNGPVQATATTDSTGSANATGVQVLLGTPGGPSSSNRISVTANDTVSATTIGGDGLAIGILAAAQADLSNGSGITILAKKDVNAVGSGIAVGVAATVQGLGIPGQPALAGISITVNGSITATAPSAVGIGASILDAANANPLTIRVGGNVTTTGAAASSGGIGALSFGTGDIMIDVGGSVQTPGIGISVTRLAAGNIFINANNITGTTGVVTSGGTATLVIGGNVTGTGGTAVQFGGTNDILRLLERATISGKVIGTGTSILQLAGTNSATFDISQLDTGFARIDSVAGSNWLLTGNSGFGGPVNVDGSLAINGRVPNAAFIVGAGGSIGGNGTIGDVTINGGTLSPGNSVGTLTMASLAMTAASTYLVQVQGTASDRAVVTGTASIAGAVVVDPLARVGQRTTYTILSAGTLSGTFNSSGFLLANNFARNPVLSYVGNDVLLTLDPGLLSPILPGNANINQRNVAAAIDGALIGGSTMNDAFGTIFTLNGNGLLNGLTQLSGETATGSQQTTFNAMSQFMGVLTDPFMDGRGDATNTPGMASGYAAETTLAYAAMRRNPSDALAAISTKAPPPVLFAQRWNVWAAGFGGSQSTDGNAVLGSNNTTSRVYGIAVGADYRFSPFTIAGFSLAGGGTNFSVANNGTGHSDLFQAGAFIRHNVGAAYVTGALAYGWQDVTVDRTVTVAGIDQLRAQFNANAWSGRVEGGYRLVAPVIGGVGITPYAAGQFTTFDLPGYAESVVSGANTFALAYGAKSVTGSRGELGLRIDKSFAMQEAILTLRGRVAWAHDFNRDRNIGATFQTLPGASFIVNGAAQASDSALVTAAAEVKWMNGWSTAATFEGEFSNVTRSYAGKGVLRYSW